MGVAPIDVPIETLIMVSMQYKRNQIEDAISTLVEPNARKPSAKLRTRIKRLFETDRASGRLRRSADPTLLQYAFFSDDPPGRGVEVQFSPYEAFALLTAIRLMGHGWTQNIAVSIMRRARSELEASHARILELQRHNNANELNFENSPFLVIITTAGNDGTEAFACSVRQGQLKAAEWTWKEHGPGQGFSMFELASHAENLATALATTEPRHRGQAG